MKKLFMLVAFIGLFGAVSVNAQTCSKGKTACCSKTVAKAASADANIESRICEKSGKVSYVRKEVCAVSGKTSYANVEFNADEKKFVNVSPVHTSGEASKKACCSKDKAAACSKKKTTAVKKKTTTGTAIKTSN